MNSCIYEGYVRHRRNRPTVHDFRYASTLFYLDLDEVDDLAERLPLFSLNRRNCVSFYDRDHVDGRIGATKRKIERWLARDGIDLVGGRIGLLTSCRLFGYVFNPVSFYYCYGRAGGLLAIVAEVNSTFGERFLYTLKPPDAGHVYQAEAVKQMHVSPFLSNRCRYQFRFVPLADRLAIGIVQQEDGCQVLDVQLWGQRQPLSAGTLARLVLRHPFLTLKTTAAIHFEALRLYLKRVAVVRQPPPTAAQCLQQETFDRLFPRG